MKIKVRFINKCYQVALRLRMIMLFKLTTISHNKRKVNICFLKENMIIKNPSWKVIVSNRQQIDTNFDMYNNLLLHIRK